MAQRRFMSYLNESLRGGYDFASEDRLSQVFSASFNSSVRFQKCFFEFIRSKTFSDATCINQQVFLAGSKCRPDICIQSARRIRIAIENKVEAPLTITQLRSYSKIKELANAKKIALVKHFFEPFSAAKGWRIRRWSDFYRFLECKMRAIDQNGVDCFIMKNFLLHLEELSMKTPARIKKSDLQLLAKAIYQLRNEHGPNFSLKKPIFEIANTYVDMLETVVNKSREEPVIRRRVGRSYRFNPGLGAYYENDKERKHMRAMIYTEIRWNKKINGLRVIGAGLIFSNRRPRNYRFVTYAQPAPGGEFKKCVEYERKDLVLDLYAKHIISNWKKWLKKKP